ncbi:histone H1.1, embryonic-like [Hydractinia symbiolongicarpus]|uniref:histone H1.1, embryonic-like n=1 Tax=Hydractinia symbiolongicarpus TaxID=13093 RepID=UPI002550CC0E|nr:histone H1.1, embryonic-like [Hydractinia symbiolongicarpus]
MASDDEVFVDTNNLTYVKQPTTADGVASGSKAAKATVKHPTYWDMVQEAILKHGGRSGISKSKICDHIKEVYQMEASNQYVVKAIKSGLEKKFIENTTGNGASGSLKITKEHKETLKKLESVKVKKEKEKAKKATQESKEVEKPKGKKQSKDDLDLPKEVKKTTKKPPLPKAGKENKEPEKGKTKGGQKTLKEKTKTLKKANSTGDLKKNVTASVDDVEPETSKKPTSRKGKTKQ